MMIFYRMSALSRAQEELLLQRIQKEVSGDIIYLRTELIYYIDAERPLAGEEMGKLKWLLAETFESEAFDDISSLYGNNCAAVLFEVGTRLNRVTPWSSNAVSILKACGIDCIKRIEVSRRYEFHLKPNAVLGEGQWQKIAALI